MAKWRAYGKVIGSKYLGTIEANTSKEAIAKAESMAHVSVCHQCSDEIDSAEIDDIEVEPAEDGDDE